MVAKDEDGISVPVPGIILDTAESVRRFARSMGLKQDVQSRSELFDPVDFDPADFLPNLVGQNVKIQL